jgi:uncharacterized membrane protein
MDHAEIEKCRRSLLCQSRACLHVLRRVSCSTRILDIQRATPTITEEFKQIDMANAIPPLPSASETGLPSNVGAGLCAIFPLLGGIIFYFIETKDQFVRHWAIQGIYFGGAWFVVSIAISIVGAILAHTPLIGLLFAILFGMLHFVVWLGGVVLWIIGIIKAFKGETWEYPYISAYGKKILPNLS